MNKRLISCLTLSLLLFSLAGINSCGKKHDHNAMEEAQAQKYYCPMHPSYTSDKPGSCPICGMDLVKSESVPATQEVKEKKLLYYRNPMDPKITSPVPMKDSMGMDYVPVYEETKAPEGSGVYISPERQQLIGVKITKVSRRNLETYVRASGKVAHDTELYTAIVEYQQAFKSSSETINQVDSLLSSTIERLKHLGLSDAQIKRYSQTSEPPSNLIMANQNGGTVWIYAQVYENEANLIKEGQLMEVTTDALPGQKFTGKVGSVGAYMNSETRSLLVRAEVSDPKGLLKPDMFVDTVVHVSIGNKVAVPEEAVLDTGTRQLVFVNKGNGMYDPRKVTVGVHAEGYYEIIEGVSPGEEVVTSANFLIDSESRLKSEIK
ncbi:MAG: hypothetical protein A3J83_02290 [Elusimicrobia bacterium RIFOXYA2_FULL_40_6]|nr:MAG: hypothetical protein A3J83_02290 [Elusimicrobia bacterium RIFOXYA2_FULL_40_6]